MADLEPKKTITLFFGGVVNIGRNMNISSDKNESFVGIREMTTADIRLVDLECVIATTGEQKFLDGHNYFRARPEQTNILVKADIDIVLTANAHSGDYGSEALLEQRKYLDAAGILYAGSGENISEAFAPVYKKVGDITLAIFSVDTTTPLFAATDTTAGTAYLPPKKLEMWTETFSDKIRTAHEKADVVIIAPHWGLDTDEKPSEKTRQLAHLLIDVGADAILGCNSHVVHGVENYKNRPIIYNAGDFLIDDGKRDSAGCFVLNINANGIEKVNFIPLIKKSCQTLRARKSAPPIIKNFVAACNEFKTSTTTSEKGVIAISFAPPARESKVVNDFADVKREKNLIPPLAEPRPEWIVDKVPDEAVIPPKKFGALKLVGYYIPPDCRTMTERKLLTVETYWTINEPVDKNYLLSIRAVPARECLVMPFGKGQEHEFLDFMWPVNRWKVGVIYREKFCLRPPAANKLANIPFRVKMTVASSKEILGKFQDSNLIKLQIANLKYPYYSTEFDDIIYQSELGKCWTAEQLAKVTGGEWIVPPPEGWYMQSLIVSFESKLPRSNLLLVKTAADLKSLVGNSDKFDAAIVTDTIKKLPKNFPLLKVDNIDRAMWEIGIAARKRFQGKVIAVTGSAGKTTTCNMLRHVFSKDHSVTATSGSSNMYNSVPRIFSRVKQDDAYAIIEFSIDVFEKQPGAITYEFNPHVAVVTSVAPAHIGKRSLEIIATRKSKIFYGMSPGGYAVLNRDMPYYEIFEQRAKSLKLKIITFGTHPSATVRMPELVDGGEIFVAGKTYNISCPVPTEQLYDALAIVGVSLAVGYSVEKTLEYLKTFSPVSGRGNILQINLNGKKLTVINSTFNANPDSMKFALQHLKNAVPEQKYRVAILGDIAALGTYSVDYHKGLADAMLAAEPDRLLLCGKFMRYSYEMVKEKLNVIYFPKLDELLKGFETHLRDGDTILIKSSHDTGLAKVVDLLRKNATLT